MNREIRLATLVIKFEEGLRLKPYYDSLRYPTIGFGELLSKKKGDPLPDITWTEEQANEALIAHLEVAVKEISTNKGTKDAWASLADDTDRKAVVLSMWYQCGITGLAGFVGALKGIVDKDYTKAAAEMLDSDAARRVAPKRWKRQAAAMQLGNVAAVYKL